ncbi:MULTISPECIES: ABC transporter ATP-binding protein [unclassified Thalassospira]|uniref:ABC transporter ATP-binding protein n=1 Tax=unclassified Thalassospira TaxID=2648997 RepID=UPI0007A5AFB5|nr:MULTISPECIES: ABC transporter ATP-binding protein [unclassified Thalassospira]KZD00481.1 ABC transporter [Thalassospira sp. MCCC 1A02898]ONH86863.1 ABC transporter [Thalassospira sp. MCCC 1A02803]
MTLTLENITKTVGGETHIDDVSMTLEPGSFNVLLGRTLAGKTTLMRIMAGLEPPTKGRILVDNADVTGMAVQKRNVAMVYQQFINYPSMNVFDNIASPLKLQGVDKAEIEKRVRSTAELMHIEHLLDRLPQELSGGQQQRTAMARAMVKDCKLLLLDEPLVNLDYKLREELREEIPNLLAERDTIVVYATTEPMEALLLGGKCAVMHEGRMTQFGPTTEVYHNPASVKTGLIFSDPPINLVEAEVRDGAIFMKSGHQVPLKGHLANLSNGDYTLGIRANHLSVDPTGDDTIAMQGQVELAEITGSETFVHVHFNDVSWVIQEEGVHNPRLGEATQFYVDPTRLFAFDANGALVAAPPVEIKNGKAA